MNEPIELKGFLLAKLLLAFRLPGKFDDSPSVLYAYEDALGSITVNRGKYLKRVQYNASNDDCEIIDLDADGTALRTGQSDGKIISERGVWTYNDNRYECIEKHTLDTESERILRETLKPQLEFIFTVAQQILKEMSGGVSDYANPRRDRTNTRAGRSGYGRVAQGSAYMLKVPAVL